MRLKLLYLIYPVKPSAHLDHHGDLVSLVQLLSCGKDVSDTIQDNMNSLVIPDIKQVTEWLKDSLPTLMTSLLHSTTTGESTSGLDKFAGETSLLLHQLVTLSRQTPPLDP